MKLFFPTLILLIAQAAHAGNPTMQANGTFDVKLIPQTGPEGTTLGRMRLEKVFHGPLDGHSVGEMLAVRSSVKNSAGYVAMEQVTATLAGRHGSFILQHAGAIDNGVTTLTVAVVPDSGTGDLAGLKGTMTINAEGGAHRYVFSYSLP